MSEGEFCSLSGPWWDSSVLGLGLVAQILFWGVFLFWRSEWLRTCCCMIPFVMAAEEFNGFR